MTTPTFDAIVRRHRPDPEESGRVCRACARPWPCDVRILATLVRPADRPTAAPATTGRTPGASPVTPRAASGRAKPKVGAVA